MAVPLEFTLLGQMRITYDSKLVTGFVSNKAQALLCYLALTGQPHPRDDLAALLWSDMPETEAKANLRVVLCNLRQLLPDYIHVDRKTVVFNPQDACSIDATAFQARLQQYDPAHEATITALHTAVNLYQGDLLHGLQPRGALLFEEWLLLQREHLRQQVMQSYYTLAAHHMGRAEYAEALQHTTRLIKMEPWHEEAHRQAMLLFTLSGQRSLALAQYKTCQQILHQELGVEPEEETVALYQRIKAGTMSVTAAVKPLAASWPEPASSLPLLPFVGRGDEFAWLMGQSEVVRAGNGGLTLLQGAAGSGKTYLAEALLRFVATTEALLLRTRCQDFTHVVPYQPVIDLLRTVSKLVPTVFDALPDYWLIALRQLLPELHTLKPNLAPALLVSEALGRQHLFEAVAVLLTELERRYGAVVVFCDDFHNADSETIDLLTYLVHRCQGAQIWYLGAYRTEAVTPGHPLTQLCQDLRRSHRLAQLELGPLSLDATRQLVESLGGLEQPALTLLSAELYRASGGNPFLLTHMLEDLVQRGILCSVRGSWWLNAYRLATETEHVPPVIQALILEQVSQLPPEVQAVLHLAAVIGPAFDRDLLTKAAVGDSQAVGQWLELLLAGRLVRELTVPAQSSPHRYGNFSELHYEFANLLIWRTIYNQLSEGERRRLTDQVAAANRVAATATRNATLSRRHRKTRTATCSLLARAWGGAELTLTTD